MKKLITLIIFLFFAIPVFVSATAPARLLVQFESTPLFENANFIPYDEVSRFVKVTNHTEAAQEVIAEAINYSSCPLFSFDTCLAKKLHLKITSGEEVYFDGKLSDFYDVRGVSLGSLGAGAMKQYDFRIVFDGGLDDNDFQNSTTNFDLLVGFAGERGEGVSSAGGGGSSGGGGGGGAVLPGLQINNEAVIAVSTDTAAVSWNTNYFSWGDVIYGIDTGTPYVLNLLQPNFGYPSSSPSDPQAPGHHHASLKSLNHIVNLSGLTPGATYRYRAVSHASPPTIGYEHTFTVPLIANANATGGNTFDGENDGVGGASEFPENGIVLGASTSDTLASSSQKREVSGNDSESSQNGNENEQNQNDGAAVKNFAAAFGTLGGVSFFWWILVIILLFTIWFASTRKKVGK
jgi:hypothetical protein